VLYGQSWGGILAMEYALAHQEHLRGLVISNMMASAPACTAYAKQVLMPAMDPAALTEIEALEAADDTENPRYMELLMPHYYEHHTLRLPADDWPDPAVRGFAHINPKIYVPMQGPSELGMSADAKLATRLRAYLRAGGAPLAPRYFRARAGGPGRPGGTGRGGRLGRPSGRPAGR
jgi:proline iminopeptidase